MIQFEGDRSFFFGCRAMLLEDNYETASTWASKHIVANDKNAWLVGRYVEADRANNNKHVFRLPQLEAAQSTITHAPLNINHSQDAVVGSFVATEFMFPTLAAGAGEERPFIESLAVLWKFYYPQAYEMVKDAHAEGTLFYSMECIPRAISSLGGTDDTKEYAYEGRTSVNYPDEINERSCDGVVLVDPHFIGGACIIPPVKPGWSNATITEVSKFMEERAMEAERAYEMLAEEAPDLEAKQWEETMLNLIHMVQLSHQ